MLNEAFYQAQRQKRTTLIEADFDTSARKISQSRYDDLAKEYESVIPGIRLLTDAFVGAGAKLSWKEAASRVAAVLEKEDENTRAIQQFKIFGTPDEAIKALYGVGFLGLLDKQTSNFVFSHDGKKPDRAFDATDMLMLHPCYWSALSLQHDELDQPDAEQIFDEYEITIASQSKEARSLLLGRLISELNQIPRGDEGADQFEDWCKRAIEIAFARQLTKVALKPNKVATQRRDVVATNQGEAGIWKRILLDYGTRMAVFEVKNYDALGVAEYRQVHSYLDREYGKCGFIICRDPHQAIEKGATLEAFREFYNKGHVIVKISATTLVSILSKLRSPEKLDAASNALAAILDDHVLLYANGQTNADGSRAKRRRRRSRKNRGKSEAG